MQTYLDANVLAPCPQECLTRTDSQVDKQAEVHDIWGHLGGYSTQISQLKEQVSLSARRIRQDADVCFDQSKKEIESLRKKARNYGEDLLEDTLALDRLTGLFAEDRNKRKEAISNLDSLLEEVDELKSDLATLDIDLQRRLEMPIEKDPNCNADESIESTDLASWSDEAMVLEESPSDEPPVIDEAHSKDTVEVENLPEAGLPEPESRCANPSNANISHGTKLVELQEVANRINNRAISLEHLDEKILRLVARMNQVDANLVDEKKVLDDCERSCRYLGEDVFDDTVALDGFSDLLDEERKIRKAALVAAQTLHDRLDKIKLSLASLKQELSSKLENSLNLQATSRDVIDKTLKKTCKEDQEVCKDGHNADVEINGITESSELNARASLPKAEHLQVPALSSKFWERLDLELHPNVIEKADSYMVSFRLRHPQPSNVNVQLNHDASQLMLTGVQLPTAVESHEMQQSIAEHLSTHGFGSCDLSYAQSCYTSLAKDRFGRFSERICLPRDVDARCISVSCDEEFLHVTLPKYVRRPRVGRANPFFW